MSWVGGDIPGLQAAGAKMKPAPGEIDAVVSELSADVDRLVDSASWHGVAADAMRAKWTRNAVEVAAVGTFIGGAGDTLEQLGNGLADVESALYNAADACGQRGAKVDQSNGKPMSLVIVGDPNSQEAKDAIQAQKEYQAAYDYAIQAAHVLRMAAEAELRALVAPIVAPSNASVPADKATMSSILRGVYTGRYEATGVGIEKLAGKREATTKEFDTASARFEQELKEFAKTGGFKLPPELLQNAENFDQAFAKFQAVEREVKTKLPELEGRVQLPGTALLNTKLGDVAKAIPKGELSAKLRLFNDIPVLDIAASGVVTYLQVKDDIAKGADAAPAIVTDGSAAATGLLSGVATAEFVSDLVPGPGWAVGAGIVAAVGVGDSVYQAFHEHWSEDIHDHGVIAGVGTGIWNSGARVVDDVGAMGREVGHMASGAWHGTENVAKSVWHGIFG